MGGGEEAGDLKAKHCMFVWGGGGGGAGVGGEGVMTRLFFFCCLFVFQSSGQLAFVKMYNFLQVMVHLKNAVCSNGICWNEKKKFLFLEEGSPEKKKKSYGSAVVVVLTDKLTSWWFSREVKTRRIHCTIFR